jgi:ubiquinone/menaquinone biosynthesis C-methylase UbiE
MNIIRRLKRAVHAAIIKRGYPVYSGAHSRQWWTSRDEVQASSQGYWDSRDSAARQLIAKTIAGLEGDSLLEIGCHAGPNLYACAKQKKFVRIAGTELSPQAMAFAQEHLPPEIGPVEIVEARADALPFADASFDVVLTGAVLLCIGPDEIMPSLDDILRVSRRWVVLAEPYSARRRDGTATGRIDRYVNTTYWIRNYAALLKDKARLIGVTRIPKPDRQGHLDSVIVLEKIRP